MLDNILVNKRISGWLSVAGERRYGKSGAVSDKLREQGNIKFGAGDNMAALKLYTESVICAPSGDTSILPNISICHLNISRSLSWSGPG